MAAQSLRDPAQIRADCARKLKPIETGDIFTAILGALLDEDWPSWVGSRAYPPSWLPASSKE